jgi:LPS sulfotransferase NodH
VSNEEDPDPVVPFWDAFGGECITQGGYDAMLADAGVGRVCVSLIPGRCGSSLLASLVEQLGCCGNGHEVFNERRASKWRLVGGSGCEYFAAAVREHSLGGVFWFQITPQRHNHLLTNCAPSISRAWRYSVILRRDIVAQAISYIYAIGSGVWHSSCPSYSPTSPVELSGDLDLIADRVFEWIAFIIRIERQIVEILESRDDGPFWVYFYEDIVRDQARAVSEFCRDAGVDVPNSLPPFQETLRRLEKQGVELVRERLFARHHDGVQRLAEERAEGILTWCQHHNGYTASP